MGKAKKYGFFFLVFFTVGFYAYHVQEFGADSLISMMSLISCLSLIGFIFTFIKVGKRV